ncbi:MAG: hypothetical protein ABSH14_01000 [Verrucomicrobiia bacterium]
MGQGNQPALRVTFDSRLKPKFQGSTSDAGLLGYREFDEALGLTGLGERAAQISRNACNCFNAQVVFAGCANEQFTHAP